MIRSLLVSAVALLATTAPVLAQSSPVPDRSGDVRAALARLPIAAGMWEGEAWFRRGPGPANRIHQVERVESRLDGLVLLIDGIGRSPAGDIVHQALATLGWDPWNEAYWMTAWTADGHVIDAEAAFDDGIFTWGFEVPDGPRIRYAISAPEPGVWEETGEVSMDGGATWYPFFGMTLQRTAGSER